MRSSRSLLEANQIRVTEEETYDEHCNATGYDKQIYFVK